MHTMRPSRVLKKLRDGDVVFSFKHNLTDPRAVDISAMSGFDCVWLCMEHTTADWSSIEAQIYAAKTWDVDTLVRVPRGCYSDMIKPLELDAAGIMVPHCMSLADAKEIVWRTKFHPVGRRPVDSGNADGLYCHIPFKDYIEQANRERFVAIQIEDPEPLDELEAIVALEGIDIVFFGPGDFSHSIGCPGNPNNPLSLETRERIAELCNKHGKYAWTVATLDNYRELLDMGYRILNVGADVTGLVAHCGAIVSALGRQPNARSHVDV